MIIDMICDINDDLKWGTKLWKFSDACKYLDGWMVYLDPAIVNEIKQGLIDGDFKRFKAGCIAYMKEYGYEGCIGYNQFKRLSIKTLKNYFTN